MVKNDTPQKFIWPTGTLKVAHHLYYFGKYINRNEKIVHTFENDYSPKKQN